MPELKFSIDASKFIGRMQSKQSQLVDALTVKMTYLMTRLQQKARAGTVGRIAESIRNPRVEVSGTVLTGKLDWGGAPTTVSYEGGKPFDIARIYAEGTTKDSWPINPLTTEGTREHVKGAKRRFGANVLGNKEDEFGPVAYVFHPKIIGRNFIKDALDEMKSEIPNEIRKTVQGVLQGF